MRVMQFVVVALALSSGCVAGRTVSIPNTASEALRRDLAGRTMECAGKARQNAGYATAGSITLSLTGSAIGAFTAVVNPTPTVEQAIVGSVLTLAFALPSLGLSIYALVANLEAAEKDQKAGRALIGEGFDGCSMGGDPKEPAVPPAAVVAPPTTPTGPITVQPPSDSPVTSPPQS